MVRLLIALDGDPFRPLADFRWRWDSSRRGARAAREAEGCWKGRSLIEKISRAVFLPLPSRLLTLPSASGLDGRCDGRRRRGCVVEHCYRTKIAPETTAEPPRVEAAGSGGLSGKSVLFLLITSSLSPPLSPPSSPLSHRTAPSSSPSS